MLKIFNDMLNLRKNLERPERMERLMRQALPIVEREALGTRPTKETWKLLDEMREILK